MGKTFEIIRGTLILLAFIAGLVWFFVRWLKRSPEDPGSLIAKWVISGLMIFVIGGAALFAGPLAPILVLPPSIILTIIWAPSIGAWVASPLTSAFDGGSEVTEPKPFYSIALSHRIHSRFEKAIEEVRKQLEKFPTDFEGQMLLAGIHVENLGDLRTAEGIMEQMLAQEGHTPGQMVSALNTLADWHLKYGESRAAARQDMERLQQMYPNTEIALLAAQRIASLSSETMLEPGTQRAPISLKPRATDIGLHGERSPEAPPEEDAGTLVKGYLKRLEQHPEDRDTREKLAAAYMEHYHKLEMAIAELEQLIATPHQPPKLVAKWLNLIADYQETHGQNPAAARETLKRIVEMYPGSAAASQAETRMVHLAGGAKQKRGGQGLQLGNYGKDLGLK